MAGAIAKKSWNTEADNGSQYISLTDYGPAIAKFDSVDATTNPAWWQHSSRRIFGIPTFIIALLIVVTCSFCWRRFKCLLGCIPWCCRSPKTMDKHSHFDTTPSSPSSEAVDMEDAMERLEFSSKAPDTQEEIHYTYPAKQVQDTMKAISESASIRAKAAHELQRNE